MSDDKQTTECTPEQARVADLIAQTLHPVLADLSRHLADMRDVMVAEHRDLREMGEHLAKITAYFEVLVRKTVRPEERPRAN